MARDYTALADFFPDCGPTSRIKRPRWNSKEGRAADREFYRRLAARQFPADFSVERAATARENTAHPWFDPCYLGC